MRRSARAQHMVQLFDSDESRAEVVADFIHDGLSAGEAVLAVLTAANWCAVARNLVDRGVGLEDALASGRLTVYDAASALAKILLAGSPDLARFDDALGSVVRRLHFSHGTIRVYGEVVDLLAAERDFVGARQVETLWNDLLATCPFTLLCGYSAVNFGDLRSASELRRICGCHSEVRTGDVDELGTWLVRQATSESSAPPPFGV